MSWFIAAVRKYAVFSGRARRKEFWYFVLFYIIFSLVLGFVDQATGIYYEFGQAQFGVFGLVYGLALLVPSLAVWVRRLHDRGRNGWWLLIGLIPLVGAIILLIFAVSDSEPGENRFGPNPKEAAKA